MFIDIDLYWFFILYKAKHTIIVTKVALSPKPTEILEGKSLVINKQVLEICLVLGDSYQIDLKNKIIKLPNGSITEIKPKLFNSDGKEYGMTLYSIRRPEKYLSDETACFTISAKDNEKSESKKFENLQISSDLPIEVKAITWINYDLK